MIDKYLNKNLLDFKAYKAVVPAEKTILASNESPFNLMDDPEFRSGYIEVIEKLNLNRYPDPNANKLRTELALYTGVNPENIIVGNGADEVIDLILSTFINPGDVVITHSPSFEMYSISAKAKGARCIRVPDVEHEIDVDEIIDKANFLKAKMLFLCIPNNPTGYNVPINDVQKIIDETSCLVILDMAYIEFSEEDYSSLELNERVIRLRTLSKAFGLASLRVGYGIANEEIIDAINLIKPPYNLNQLSQDLAAYTVKNRELLADKIALLKSEKERVYEAFRDINNVKVFPTGANFLLVKIEDEKINKFNSYLKANDIKVKIFSEESGMNGYYRITVGKPEENNLIIQGLKNL